MDNGYSSKCPDQLHANNGSLQPLHFLEYIDGAL